MSTEEALHKFNHAFNSLFGFSLESRTGYKDNEGKIMSWKDYMLSSNNGSFKDSPYYFEKKELVHFTSCNNLKSIVKSKALWLFDLNNLNDPREFSYASRIFDLEDKEIAISKKGQYVVSCCETSILNISKFDEQFNMWRLYGNDGKGVAIVFSVDNDRNKWNDFHLSPMQYGVDGRTKFATLIKLLKQINKDSEIISVDLGKLYPFHKSKLYQGECEVRLMWDDRQNQRKLFGTSTRYFEGNQEWPTIGKHPKKHNVNYLSLPLNSSKIDNDIPALRIKEVILGYNHTDKDLELESDKIKKSFLESFGYEPKVSRTELYSEYADISAKIFPTTNK